MLRSQGGRYNIELFLAGRVSSNSQPVWSKRVGLGDIVTISIYATVS